MNRTPKADAFERDPDGWPVCCGSKVSVDMGLDPPEGVCDLCGQRFEVEGEVQTTEITVGNLLGDASQVLIDTGKPTLAQVVRVARDMIDGETGETWLRDVLRVLDEAEVVVAAARDGNETVVLDGLARALDDCSTWGLNPQQRARNALRELVSGLCLARTVIHSQDRDSDKLAQVWAIVTDLMKGLGFDQE